MENSIAIDGDLSKPNFQIGEPWNIVFPSHDDYELSLNGIFVPS